MSREYHEGPEALDKFNKMLAQVFKAPKSASPFAKPKATKKAVPKTARKKRVSRKQSGKAGD
jgi:hypothetical protein